MNCRTLVAALALLLSPVAHTQDGMQYISLSELREIDDASRVSWLVGSLDTVAWWISSEGGEMRFDIAVCVSRLALDALEANAVAASYDDPDGAAAMWVYQYAGKRCLRDP